MAKQLSIFVENKPGKLEKITDTLADGGFNIRGISMANAGEFGIVKIIVDRPEEAYSYLISHKITVSTRNITAVRIGDRPGSLHDMLTILSGNNINIEDCYGVSVAYNKSAAIILEIEKCPEAIEVLKLHNIDILTDREIYSL